MGVYCVKDKHNILNVEGNEKVVRTMDSKPVSLLSMFGLKTTEKCSRSNVRYLAHYKNPVFAGKLGKPSLAKDTGLFSDFASRSP